MDVSRYEQRRLVLFFVVISLAGFILLILWGLQRGVVLSENSSLIITGSIPHEITIQTIPEARIPPVGNDALTETIEFRAPGSLLSVYSTEVTTDAQGSVTLSQVDPHLLPPGQYDIAIKGASHLRRVFANQSLDGPMIKSLPLQGDLLLAGDVNTPADNLINSLDFSFLVSKLFTNDAKADLTHDTIVNSLDLSVLLNNLNVYGDN